MQLIIEKLKVERHRKSTQKNYYSIWRIFNQFFIKLDSKPKTWEERLTLFIAYLIQTNIKSNTIKCYISAIKAVLLNDGYEINEDRMLLTSLTRACCLKNDKVCTRLPIRKGLLSLIIKSLPQVIGASQQYLIVLYTAMLLTAYYGMFRIGELSLSEHVIQVGNVHAGVNKDKLMFILTSSKTHGKDKKPQIIKIDALSNCSDGTDQDGVICPFKAIKEYIKMRRSRKLETEPFFIFRDRSPVLPAHYRKLIKDSIKHLGLQERFYMAHGTRAGRASDLFSMKISVETIRKLGRWSSSAIYQYFRQ